MEQARTELDRALKAAVGSMNLPRALGSHGRLRAGREGVSCAL